MKVYCVFEEVPDDFGGFVPRLISIHKDKESANLKKAFVIGYSDRGCWHKTSDVIVEEWEIESEMNVNAPL